MRAERPAGWTIRPATKFAAIASLYHVRSRERLDTVVRHGLGYTLRGQELSGLTACSRLRGAVRPNTSERVERAADADAGVPGRVQADLVGGLRVSPKPSEVVFLWQNLPRPDRLPQRLLRMVQKDYFAVNPRFSRLSTVWDNPEVR